MSFIPNMSGGLMMGTGNRNAKIIVIGDCIDQHAKKQGKPIAGPSESTLEDCLHQAGLTKSEIFYTNVLKDVFSSNLKTWWNTRTKRPIKSLDDYVKIVEEEIEQIKPDVLVTLGELPAFVFTHNGACAKTRGYPFLWEDRIVVPTMHPRDAIWSNYISRYYISHDLNKAKKLSEDRDLLYAPEIETRIPESFEEAKQMLDICVTFDILSVDIEVANFEVSCIGFATHPHIAYSIPFDMRWTLQQEVELWNKVANIMIDPRITKIGQNFIFDIHFLAYKMGIVTRGKIVDTMMSHSILYPDFLKSLNFLASIHTFQPYWKNMVKFKDIKAES